MSRISAIEPTRTTGKTADLLAAVGKALGAVPNLFRVAAHSPAALEGLVSLNGALQRGKLPGRTREAIALAIAQFDRCDYCLSAHSVLGKGAGLTDADITAARDGQSADERTAAALRLARSIAVARGHISDSELEAARRSLGDGEIVEVVALVALNVLTNYLNSVAATDIDFPEVHHER
jgi:AhpD family alkylhydroperoxidase